MSECTFCKMIRGEIPFDKIYENERVLAFLDDKPINPGHSLVIPKTHYATLFDISPEDLMECIRISQRIAPVILRAANASGLNLVQNNNDSAGQSVDHVHFHLIPRHDQDGFLTKWSGDAAASGEAGVVLETIRAKIGKSGI